MLIVAFPSPVRNSKQVQYVIIYCQVTSNAMGPGSGHALKSRDVVPDIEGCYNDSPEL